MWLLCHEASKQTKNDIEDNPNFDVNHSFIILTYFVVKKIKFHARGT